MQRKSMPAATLSDNTETVESGKSFRALVTIAIVISLSLAVLVLRFYRLSELPPGIQSDEGPDGVYALDVLAGNHSVFFPDKGSGREAVGVYAVALATSILGRTLLAFHLPTAMASSGTVFAVFWLGQLLFGRNEECKQASPWRGLIVGGVGAGLMAVSVSQTFLARAGLRANYLPLFLTLSFALLWWAWQQRDRKGGPLWKVALAGVCAGLLLHTYLAARITPFLFLLFGLSFLLPLRTKSTMMERFGRAKPFLSWVGLFVGAAALVGAPLLIYFALLPDDFTIRSRQLSLLSGGQGNLLFALLENAWEHILVLGFRGDQHHRYNFAGLPMLNPWQAIFFWLGVGTAAYRWKMSPANRLLLLWLGVLLLPAMLADTRGEGPNSLRMIGATPAIYLLTGSGAWEAYRFLMARLSAWTWRHLAFFPSKDALLATVGAAVVIVLIAVQGFVTYRSFFNEWAGSSAFSRAYHGEWAEAASVLNKQKSVEDDVYIIPYPLHYEHFNNDHFGFEFLYQGAAPAYILAATTPDNLAQRVEAILSAEELVSSVRFLDWNNELVGGDARAEEHTVALLEKYARHSHVEDFGTFEIHRYAELSLEAPWSLNSSLQPLTIHYDKGISLYGFALGQAASQLQPRQDIYFGSVKPIWVVLQWQSAPAQDTDFSASLRLYDTEGVPVSQNDFVLKNAASLTTSHWTSEEWVDTLSYLDLPAELPSGHYELRLVVYDFESHEPTVELGVWKPETVLAHLRLELND